MGALEYTYLILSIVFLLICAFFSSAEIGFINLQRIRLKHLQEEGVKGADRVASIMERPERFLSTVLTGVSFAETIVVSLGTIFIVALLGEGMGTPVAIVVIALLLLIFAKVIPKTIAAQHPERIALLYGGVIELITRLLYPLVIALSWIAARIAHLMRSSTMPGALISREEISTMISLGEEEGVVDEAAARMMHSVVGLGECQVWEVMTPRTEATWLEQGATLSDFYRVYAESPALRYPIFEETYDNVKGTLSVRDVLKALAQSSLERRAVVTDLARPVYLVPGSKTVGQLLSEMRDEGYLMAVVVNEYGGTSGVVTIEQLLEEIVGEVKEELAGAEKAFEVVGERAYRIRGSMRVDEVNEQLQLGLPEGDYKTMGGFALNLFGHLPKKGEQAVYEDLRFIVAELEGNKIARLFVKKEKIAEKAEESKDEGAPDSEKVDQKQPDKSRAEEPPRQGKKKAQSGAVPETSKPLEGERGGAPDRRCSRKGKKEAEDSPARGPAAKKKAK